MLRFVYFLTIIFEFLNAVYLYDYEDDDTTQKVNLEDVDFEPVVPENLSRVVKQTNNIDCGNFFEYSYNCTKNTSMIYDAYRRVPPLANRINDWCKAIKFLSNCATTWNDECKDVTENKYSVESITGHLHVVNHICNNELFLIRYNQSQSCVENTTDMWEGCYLKFRQAIEDQRKSAFDWTHYVSHFYLCCARAQFRRCTFDFLFTTCSHEESLTMQKFSIIVSEGEVFQDCDHNMLYENCPGGDPRPSDQSILKLVERTNKSKSTNHSLYCIVFALFIMCLFVF